MGDGRSKKRDRGPFRIGEKVLVPHTDKYYEAKVCLLSYLSHLLTAPPPFLPSPLGGPLAGVPRLSVESTVEAAACMSRW